MKELYELIKYLKDNGYEHLKINPDLLVGIVEYFESKQEPKTTEQEALHIGSVSGCYWEKPKKIELKLEDMASGEMKGNVKGLK